MAKLTAAQQRALETIAYHLNRAQAFLSKPDVIVAMKKSHPVPTTTLDFILPDGTVAFAIDKEIGSDLAGLEMGMQYLKNFVEFNSKQ